MVWFIYLEHLSLSLYLFFFYNGDMGTIGNIKWLFYQAWLLCSNRYYWYRYGKPNKYPGQSQLSVIFLEFIQLLQTTGFRIFGSFTSFREWKIWICLHASTIWNFCFVMTKANNLDILASFTYLLWNEMIIISLKKSREFAIVWRPWFGLWLI